jgi:predicted DNA-binding transcriptional regulator YafY
VRADRLLSLVLLLQARGSATARSAAAELGVSVRTVYRDLAALGAAGIPVITESGPGGGCKLMDGYRFPLRGLRPDEAEALLMLGVPDVVRELGLDRAVAAAHRQIRVTAGLAGQPPGRLAADGVAVHRGADRAPAHSGAAGTLVHLDMPRWFGTQEDVPCLRELAQALRLGRMVRFGYRRQDGSGGESRVLGPLGLVNKAGAWYLVAVLTGGDPAADAGGAPGADAGGDPKADGAIRVFRAGRIFGAFMLAESFRRPADFDLARFWAQWSAEFAASRPRIAVTLRASPDALAVFPEIFGQAAGPVLEAALPPDEEGWRTVTLSFEHELAAAYRLAGFGGLVQVLSPLSVREELVLRAREILARYDAGNQDQRYAPPVLDSYGDGSTIRAH